jgi:hypothetical protein
MTAEGDRVTRSLTFAELARSFKVRRSARWVGAPRAAPRDFGLRLAVVIPNVLPPNSAKDLEGSSA